MDLNRPLSVITPTVDADVLAVLAGAQAAFTGRQVHQVAGRHSERGIRNALHRLCTQGIVHRERVGAADQYRLNRAHLAAPYIEALAGLRDQLLQRISGELDRWAIAPVFAALFGSAARGEMRPDSDIDLLVVREDTVDADDPVWRDQVDALAREVTTWTGNDTRVLEFGAGEVRAGLDAGDAVLLAARDEGIVLHGRLTYLSSGRSRRTAGGRRG
ncbi:MAG: nucleotidyltransferase domain-containing protein [Anaerolineales bacterium]